MPFKSYDPVLSFFHSFYHYYSLKVQFRSYDVKDFSLVQKGFDYSDLSYRFPDGAKPNVLIVMVESFNAYFVESQNDQGQYFTPVFNDLIDKGLYVEHFYGNSVQSCKGQFATLTSLVPPIYGFGFRHYFGTKYKTLAEIMYENGYYNVFFQASGNLLADNTKAFLDHHYFDEVKSARHYVNKDDQDYIFGWGVQDRLLYKYFFQYFDDVISKQDKPFFAILPTIFTHNNTVQIPQKDRSLYPDAKKSFEYFSNVIHLTDQQLNILLKALEDRGLLDHTVLIITGDHSRSAIADSQVSFNQTGFNDDIFKVPYLMIWKDVLPSMRIRNVAYSQLDIAPTLVDLLGLSLDQHHFQGVSIFAKNDSNDVFLVQPYDGIYLSVVNFPYKYGKHLQTGREFLFNLLEDPNEQLNIISDYQSLSKIFQSCLEIIFKTNRLIESNKVWRDSF